MPDKYELAIYSIIIDPDTEDQDAFILVLSNLDSALDTPLTSEGYFVLFETIDQAAKALAMSDIELHEILDLPDEETLTLNIAQVSYLIQEGEFDDSAAIINFLNVIFDLVASSPFIIPEDNRSKLYALADHCTSSKDIKLFFTTFAYSRKEIMDCILWLVGALFANAKILRSTKL